MTSRKAIVAIASGLVLTGAEAQADIIVAPDTAGISADWSDVEFESILFDSSDDMLDVPPLLEAEDEIVESERIAQTVFGGSGNDGIVGGPQAPGTRIPGTRLPGTRLRGDSPRLEPVSKPATAPKLRQRTNDRTLRRNGSNLKRRKD